MNSKLILAAKKKSKKQHKLRMKIRNVYISVETQTFLE